MTSIYRQREYFADPAPPSAGDTLTMDDVRDIWDGLMKQRSRGPDKMLGLGALLVPEPTRQRIAPAPAAQHTMRAQAILSLGDTPKHQCLALQHLEAAFIAANPGYAQ